MTTDIDLALEETATLIKDLNVSNSPNNRVWAHPSQADSIEIHTLPFVVVSKLNMEPGNWDSFSFGEGRHSWQILIAAFLAKGPIVVTDPKTETIKAVSEAHEWYKELSDVLYQNITLNGNAEFIGSDGGNLFEYVTDNIIWQGQQYYGHLFMLPITQLFIQPVSN